MTTHPTTRRSTIIMIINKALAAAAVVAALTSCTSTAADNDDSSSSGGGFFDDAAAPDDDATLESAIENGLTDTEVEELYTSMVKTNLPTWFGSIPDSEILAIGRGMCTNMDIAGMTFYDTVTQMVDAGYDHETAGQFIGYTTAALCPEYNL